MVNAEGKLSKDKKMRSNKVSRFINKYGKAKWLRKLHRRMEEKRLKEVFKSSSYYMEEISRHYDFMQKKTNKMEERLHSIEQALERLESKP